MPGILGGMDTKIPGPLRSIQHRDGGTFIIVVRHYWGRGATVADAVAECRRAGATDFGNVAVFWSEKGPKDPEAPYVDALGRLMSWGKLDELVRRGL